MLPIMGMSYKDMSENMLFDLMAHKLNVSKEDILRIMNYTSIRLKKDD